MARALTAAAAIVSHDFSSMIKMPRLENAIDSASAVNLDSESIDFTGINDDASAVNLNLENIENSSASNLVSGVKNLVQSNYHEHFALEKFIVYVIEKTVNEDTTAILTGKRIIQTSRSPMITTCSVLEVTTKGDGGSPTQISRKSKKLKSLLDHLSNNSDDLKVKILYQFLHNQLPSDLIDSVLCHSKFQKVNKLSPEQCVEIQASVNLTTNQIRKFRKLLPKKLNFFQSDEKMRNEINSRTTATMGSEENWDSGSTLLQKSKSGSGLKEMGFIKVKDLKSFVLERIQSLESYIDLESFNSEIWLCFGGDHGLGLAGSSIEGTYKEFFSILNLHSGEKKLSCEDLFVYLIFEGMDTLHNLEAMVKNYKNDINELRGTIVKVNGIDCKIRIFNIFDNERLDKQMGHQTSTSTFPSSHNKVTLKHLSKHSDHPHTLENCSEFCELRSMEEIDKDYRENMNLQNLEESPNLRKSAKHTHSIISQPLMELDDVLHYICPLLHIFMGIVNRLVDDLTELCSTKDKSSSETVLRLKEIDSKLVELSSKIQDLNDNQIVLSGEILACQDSLVEEEEEEEKEESNKSKLLSMLKQEEEIKSQIHDFELKEMELLNEKGRKLGFFGLKLQNSLKNFKILPQAYHGGKLHGRDCLKLIEHGPEIVSFLEEDGEKFVELFSLLKNILSALFKKKHLKEEEINQIIKLINNFSKQYNCHFPQRSITRKMSDFFTVTPLILKKFKTYGYFLAVEQAGESLHRHFANSNRRFCTINSKGLRLNLILRNMYVLSSFIK